MSPKLHIKKNVKKTAVNVNSLLAVINEKAQEHKLKQPEFRELLDELAKDISSLAATSPNEATISTHMEMKLYGLLKDVFSREFLPEKETPVDTVRHIKKGRLDSRVGALVVEYKHYSKLVTPNDQKSAISQLENYLTSMTSGVGQTLTGILTDGKCALVMEVEAGKVAYCSSLQPLRGEHLEHFVRHALLLDRTALSPENLVNDFCSPTNQVAMKLASSLLFTLNTAATDRSRMLFQEWQSLFSLAHDDVSKQQAIIDRRKSLADAFDILITSGDNETEYKALFALQTAFAIIVKVIALKVISAIREGDGEVSFQAMAKADDSTLQSKLLRLEEGDVFREMGFSNLLEGDFFAWYCTPGQWSPSIATAVRTVFETLTKYEEQPLFKGSDGIRDFLKDLYMNVIPDKVRHSLGEFYTPPWLADHVVRQGISRLKDQDNFTVLDPCCGSGTFLTTAIRHVLAGIPEADSKTKLSAVIGSVKGIDLNPLAVLTARINYFINISSLIEDGDEFEIPVFLGDSSYVPSKQERDGVNYIDYEIKTLRGPLPVTIPASAIDDAEAFSRAMTGIEQHIRNLDEESIVNDLWSLSATKEAAKEVEIKRELSTLATNLVDLERNDWNGIWARIVTNYLTTASLGHFDLVVGNPPWVDWKNLPDGYRKRIIDICIGRNLFSGDGITGGINLNICALIANVAADNWLDEDGVLAFLMPDTLLYQQSYEGFRHFHLSHGRRLYFQHIDDWTKAGHPFSPVTQKFLTYIFTAKEQDYVSGIPVQKYEKRPNSKTTGVKALKDFSHTVDFMDIAHVFNIHDHVALTANKSSTNFTFASNSHEHAQFTLIAGNCGYAGREGIEFYPQELFLLSVLDKSAPVGKVRVLNYQNKKSKHKIAQQERIMETVHLHPLVKGTQISRFKLADPEFVVPFPYDDGSRGPIESKRLAKSSPLLLKYFNDHKSVMDLQTAYNDKIIGAKHANEFYALARVGAYSYGQHFVAFRDNSKWGAVVVSNIDTPWGESKRPVFQNHAVTISQRPDGQYISLDEAHFICAIFNAPSVAQYILKSSDSRSFKIRPPITVPIYDSENPLHCKLSYLSKEAHNFVDDAIIMEKIDADLNDCYLELLQ